MCVVPGALILNPVGALGRDGATGLGTESAAAAKGVKISNALRMIPHCPTVFLLISEF